MIALVIVIQLAVFSVIAIKRKRDQYHELVAVENQRAKPVASTSESCPAWDGFKEFEIRERIIEDRNASICSFYLMPVDGNPLPDFRPGQFLTFKIEIEDPVTQQPKSIIRCYSLSDSPRSDYYRISVKRVLPPGGHPEVAPGLSSNFFHDHLKEGDRLQVKAPSGHFHLMEGDSVPIVLIGGGIGITPMLSILNFVLERSIDREVWLYYGVRNGDEVIMQEQLQRAANKHDNFHLHICYSAPLSHEVEGSDYHHNSRVNLSLLRATLKMARYQFYVCGPKAMMESLVPDLEGWGVDQSDIFYESFGPASVNKRRDNGDKTALTSPVTVTFSQTGSSILWDPAASSLLEFAENNGIEVDSGCRAGSCGFCQTALESGEVEYSQEADADIAAGHCLLCISTPKNNLTLSI